MNDSDDAHCGVYGSAQGDVINGNDDNDNSLADYVLDVTEETTAIPQSLRYYIDWQAMARDAELSGELFTIQTAHDAVHVSAGC